MKVLVTGASGFIGGYLVKELISTGHEVTALCQPESPTNFLRQLGATIAVGDVTDPKSLIEPCRGKNWVFHGAAIVGGYGHWDGYYKIGVMGTEHMINAAAAAGVERFFHISSIAVYGTRPRSTIFSETTSFDEKPERWNHYVKQKVWAEKLLWKAHADGKIRAVAVRPSLVLGPRDRGVVSRTLNIIRSPFGVIIGDGTNRVPCVVVDELVSCIVRAASVNHSVGKAYNLSGRTPITQLEFMNLHATAAGLKLLSRKVPMPLAKLGCSALENMFLLFHREDEPFCTRIALAFAANDFEIDCSQAVRDLAWEGKASYQDAIRGSVNWYLKYRD
jgi:nucleoside-diphosphate-sugar epimerase